MPPKKKSSEKKVAAIFSLPPKLRDELNRKIPAGYRSKFVAELIAREFGKSPAAASVSAVVPAKQNLFRRLFKK
jgi:hypothetical protein